MKGFNYRFLTLVFFMIGKVNTISAYDIDNGGLYYDIIPYNSNNEGYELCVTGYDTQRTVSFYAWIPDELFIDGITYKVTEIASFAFSDDDMWLEGVTIGKNVKKIGSFRNLGALHYLSVDSENTIFDSRNNCNAIIETETNTLIVGCSKTIIPNTVSTIATGAFQGCGTWISNYFETIVIPSSVTSIGYGCFAGCDNLRSILVDSNNSVYDSRNNCNAIIETNTNALIAGCNNTIIPDGITSIGKYAFHGCSGLVSVIIPENTLSIDFAAFSNCSSLTSVYIPSSVTTIGSSAFSGCGSLISVKIMRETPINISSTTFSNTTNAVLYVPIGSKEKYAKASYWKDFKEIIEIEEDSDTDISQMENVIYTEPTSGLAGTTIDLCMKLKNVLTPVGCSFKLTLPEGLRLQTDGDGDVVYELGSRAKKMSLTMQDWGDGSYDFALTPSSATATITGNDDTFITFHVVLPDDMEAGDYKLKLTRCLIQSKTDGTTKDYALSDVVSTLTVEDYIMGDVNGDRTITPSDAIMTLYHYFSVEQTGFNTKAADVNGDGTVTPADAIETLYMYFGTSSNAARQKRQICEQQ